MKQYTAQCTSVSLAMFTLSILITIPNSIADISTHQQTGTDSVGSLFTTPRQRLILNRLRQRFNPYLKSTGKKTDYSEKKLSQDKYSRKILQLNGIVRRSNGKVYAWIGNKQVLVTGKHNKLILIKDRNSQTLGIQLNLPGQSHHINLKPGQTYMIDYKWIVENYAVPGFVSNIKSEPVKGKGHENTSSKKTR